MHDVKKRIGADPALYPIGSIESRAAARALAKAREQEKYQDGHWIDWTVERLGTDAPTELIARQFVPNNPKHTDKGFFISMSEKKA